MSRFSKRYGYDEKVGKDILEDFPEWTRVALIQILEELLYVDMDSRYNNEQDRPIGIKEIHKKFFKIRRIEMNSLDYDSWHCEERLYEHLKSAPWYYIYDFIELVSKELKEYEGNYLFEDEKLKAFGFNSFQKEINELFKEDNILWLLNEDGKISRKIPEVLGKTVSSVENQFQDKFEPARSHYKKAIKYIFSFPIDSENGIKEIVSAIESVGRTIYPKSSTLGQVIKELKKEPTIPNLLVDVIDKLYIFSNATPAVRHGGRIPSEIEIEDAEFVFYTGVSLIRYLMKLNELKITPNITSGKTGKMVD